MRTTKQSGITILIAVLVMSGVTLISLSVAAFTLQEISSSRAVTISEPAIAAAESAGEQGLWSVKRVGPLIDCDAGTVSAQLSPQSSSHTVSCQSYGPSTVKLTDNLPLTFYLYDPYDANGDFDLQGCLPCFPQSTHPAGFLYDNLRVTHITGNRVIVNVSRLDTSTTGIPLMPITINPGQTSNIALGAVTQGTEGRLVVTLEADGGDVTVEIDTNKGLPNFPTLNVTGCSARREVTDCNEADREIFNRRIDITIPQ